MKWLNQRIIAADSKTEKSPDSSISPEHLFLSYVLVVALVFCVVIVAIYLVTGIQQKIQISDAHKISRPAAAPPNAGSTPVSETAPYASGAWSTNAVPFQ